MTIRRWVLVLLFVSLVIVAQTKKSKKKKKTKLDTLEFVTDLEEDIVRDFAANGTDVNQFEPSELDEMLPDLVGDDEGDEIPDNEEDMGEVADEAEWWVNMDEEIPDSWDIRDLGVMPPAMYQGGGCASCGFVAGVQSLEARIAMVAENHVPYSIQNIMNCDGRVCVGTQPYRVASLLRNSMHIVPFHEMRYTKAACTNWGPGKTMCQCGKKLGNYTNVLDDQFVFLGPTVPAKSEEKLKRALLSGPVTTCYTRKGARALNAKCKNGCAHSNSIIGYNETNFWLQESYGRKWGKSHDGTWNTPIDNRCGLGILQKAYFTSVFYDYDRANAYFTEAVEIESKKLHILDEATVTRTIFYDPKFTNEDTKNIGLAKNRCAFLGRYCKGVMQASDGEFKLVSDVKKLKRADKGPNLPKVKFFKKTQMVVYFYHEATGKSLLVNRKKGVLRLGLTKKGKKGSPFFTSYGRVVSYEYPNYHMVENNLQKIEDDIKFSGFEKTETWALNDCNLHNKISDMSLDLKEIEMASKKSTYIEYGIMGAATNLTSKSQRFNVGISGTWSLKSSKLLRPLLRDKKSGMKMFSQPANKMKSTSYRWNARQLMSNIGKPFDQNFNMMAGFFEFSENPDNAVYPTDCQLVKSTDSTARLVVLKTKNLKMIHGVAPAKKETGDRWTLSYGNV